MSSAFRIEAVEQFLSPFHSAIDKERILRGLAQFTYLGQLSPSAPDYEKEIEKVSADIANTYLRQPFYSSQKHGYFLQADILPKVKLPIWNKETNTFQTGEQDALLISNACDCDLANVRQAPKSISLVPVFLLETYLTGLKRTNIQVALATGKAIQQATEIADKKVAELGRLIRLQRFTNIFFLPESHNGDIKERIALLDRPFTYNANQWRSGFDELLASREASLSLWAYYLFIFKLSFHLCRLPEAPERYD